MLATQAEAFPDSASIVTEGQIALPNKIRSILGVDNGSRVTFIIEDGAVRIVNSAVYAMQVIQREMAGEAQRLGLDSEETINALVKEIRREGE
ncbi:MAG: AbrB/MazE/SpoVT family DNA-binding domain-containing protein [Selenomonadaceae bacterium]|nr:AbrB/MazE/SpoVT family DNA-binding domain-containing protein [Selenomonadaceae bacterium]